MKIRVGYVEEAPPGIDTMDAYRAFVRRQAAEHPMEAVGERLDGGQRLFALQVMVLQQRQEDRRSGGLEPAVPGLDGLAAKVYPLGLRPRIEGSEILERPPVPGLALVRLAAARQDLRRASPSETVTQIAMRHGAWELGRFAHRYKHLFGEHPSETLSASTKQPGPT